MATEIKMPQLGLTMEEGTVERWLKSVGDEIKAGEPILEITTDKLTNEVEAETDGVLLKIVADEGSDVPVQGILGYIGQPGENIDAAGASEVKVPAAAPAAEAPKPEASVITPAVTETGKKVRISPLARKIAMQKGIDYTVLKGTGPGGRIIKRDILAAESAPAAAVKEAPKAPSSEVAPKAQASGSMFPVKNLELMDGDTTEKLSGMRKVVAQRMYTSAVEIPAVTQTVKADVTKLMALRQKLKEEGRHFAVNDWILKAVAKALRKHPEMLVCLDGETIIHRAHVNLGMAVALDAGLIVPVIRDADTLGLEALSAKAKDLANRARSNQLGADEYKGSTFTVSNLGMFGVESFSPIINQPDAAILGVCCTEDELVMEDDGTITKHQVMRISLTFDHRLVDGAVAAKFEMTIRDLLENPMDILL